MADSVRDEIGRALEGALTPEQLAFLMEEVLAIKKTPFADFECKHCGRKQRHKVEIPDARAVTTALKDLLDQSWGRPTEQKSEQSIVVNREVFVVADDDPVDVPGE